MKDSLQFYGSKPALLEGVDEVNHWVEEATNGRIKDFLSSLPEDVVLLLLNAVHFKGELRLYTQTRTHTDTSHTDTLSHTDTHTH